MSYTGNQCQGLHTIILPFFLSFFIYFFLSLFISLKYYIWDASSARLHLWLQKKKNHLPKCELERREGADGGGGGLTGYRCSNLSCVWKQYPFSRGFSFLCAWLKKKKKKKKKNTIFQQSFQFPTLNDSLTLRTVRKEVDLFIYLFILFYFILFFIFFTHQYQDG